MEVVVEAAAVETITEVVVVAVETITEEVVEAAEVTGPADVE